jgi:hemin uptake protein HemP
LDGEKIGETPLSSENLKPGDHEIKIHRVSETENFYQDVVSPIYLEPNTRTFVETEIGPSDQFTSLTILYYQKNKTNKSGLYLDTNPKQSVVWIDEIRQGSSPITSNTLKEGRHEVKITHPGYEDLETTLIIRRGYTLIADIQLMAKPVDTN